MQDHQKEQLGGCLQISGLGRTLRGLHLARKPHLGVGDVSVQCAANLLSEGCSSIPTTRGVGSGLMSEGNLEKA